MKNIKKIQKIRRLVKSIPLMIFINTILLSGLQSGVAEMPLMTDGGSRAIMIFPGDMHMGYTESCCGAHVLVVVGDGHSACSHSNNSYNWNNDQFINYNGEDQSLSDSRSAFTQDILSGYSGSRVSSANTQSLSSLDVQISPSLESINIHAWSDYYSWLSVRDRASPITPTPLPPTPDPRDRGFLDTEARADGQTYVNWISVPFRITTTPCYLHITNDRLSISTNGWNDQYGSTLAGANVYWYIDKIGGEEIANGYYVVSVGSGGQTSGSPSRQIRIDDSGDYVLNMSYGSILSYANIWTNNHVCTLQRSYWGHVDMRLTLFVALG